MCASLLFFLLLLFVEVKNDKVKGEEIRVGIVIDAALLLPLR